MGQIKKLGSATQGLFALQMSMHFKVQHVLFSVSNTTIKACFISTCNIQLKDSNEEKGKLKPFIVKTQYLLCCFTKGAALRHDFTLVGQHVMSNAAKGCLEEMISENKYTIHPFLAYNVLKKIINPKDYRKIVAGVTVKLCFNLMHYTIAKHRDNRKQIKGNTFTTACPVPFKGHTFAFQEKDIS